LTVRLNSSPRASVQLRLQALDEILGTSVLPFGDTLAYLIYHRARRAIVLQPVEQLLFFDREIDSS